MKTLIVRVDCGEKECGGCDRTFAESSWCEVFADNLDLIDGYHQRLPQCLAAQKEVEAMEAAIKNYRGATEDEEGGVDSLLALDALRAERKERP